MKRFTFRKKPDRGFTLIEVIIVVFIVAVMASITVVQFSSYRRGVNLETTAEEIALNLRKAQSMALAVRSTGGTVLPVYQNGFGVHFATGGGRGTQEASSSAYIIFTDFEGVPGPGGWDRAYLKNFNIMSPCGTPRQTVDECFERVEIQSGDRITNLELCSGSASVTSPTPTVTSGSGLGCSPVPAGGGLDITFLRPNLDAYFCVIPPSGGGCRSLVPSAGQARITVTSPTGVRRTVSVWSTGQISIE